MISEKMNAKLNEQIKNELYSGHLYLSMGAFCSSINMDGFANYLIVHEQEERFHAMKFFHYINDQEGTVKILALDQPETEFSSLEDVFEQAWQHEKKVTQLVIEIMDLAVKEGDYATQGVLKWFIDEQVEEEASMKKIYDNIKLLGEKGQGIFMMDKEMGQRVFTPPA